MDRTLSVHSEPGNEGNNGVLRIPQSSSITGTSPWDCLMSYLGYSLVVVLPLSIETVSVFYGHIDLARHDLVCVYFWFVDQGSFIFYLCSARMVKLISFFGLAHSNSTWSSGFLCGIHLHRMIPENFVPAIGLVVRVFANGPGDLGSIPGRVIPKTQKMVLDASLLNTQHYKVRIKAKVEQSRERSSAFHYTSVL